MKGTGDGIDLARIVRINWILLAALTLAAGIGFSLRMALSVLTGGGLATLSFFWLKKDMRQLLTGNLSVVKLLFFIKYYARVALVAIALYLLITKEVVDIFGLLAGLTTIVASIVITAVWEIPSSMKEAS